MIKTERGRRAHEGDIKEFFGFRRQQKWPDNGAGYMNIQGIYVQVISKALAKERGVFHRARAYCPKCNAEMSVGRLFQHVCK